MKNKICDMVCSQQIIPNLCCGCHSFLHAYWSWLTFHIVVLCVGWQCVKNNKWLMFKNTFFSVELLEHFSSIYLCNVVLIWYTHMSIQGMHINQIIPQNVIRIDSTLYWAIYRINIASLYTQSWYEYAEFKTIPYSCIFDLSSHQPTLNYACLQML